MVFSLEKQKTPGTRRRRIKLGLNLISEKIFTGFLVYTLLEHLPSLSSDCVYINNCPTSVARVEFGKELKKRKIKME